MNIEQNRQHIIREKIAELNQKRKEVKLKLFTILWQKFLRNLDFYSFREIFGNFLKYTISLTLIICVFFYQEEAMNLIEYFFAKFYLEIGIVLIGVPLIIFCEQFLKILCKTFKSIKIPNLKKEVPNILGVPKSEIIDHLISFGSFRRTEICQKFKIPIRQYEKIAKKLSDKNIIFKSKIENNARIFVKGLSREMVATILDFHNEIREPQKTEKILEPNIVCFQKRQIV